MKIAVGVTGASGAIYAKLFIEALNKLSNQIEEVGIVFSSTARFVWKFELESQPNIFDFTEYKNNNFMAPFASGSAGYDALVIIPCSMGTLGRIANGTSETLMLRAADVMLKERRKLILVAREAPLNLIHIKNMETLTQAGAIICPATPSFYNKPQTIEEACLTVVNRVIDLIGLKQDIKRWGEEK